jgi:hypothetical protein
MIGAFGGSRNLQNGSIRVSRWSLVNDLGGYPKTAEDVLVVKAIHREDILVKLRRNGC